MVDDIQAKIQSLEAEIRNLKSRVDRYERYFELHQHTGYDKSSWLYDTNIFLKNSLIIASGNCSIVGFKGEVTDNYRYLGVLASGQSVYRGVASIGNETNNINFQLVQNWPNSSGETLYFARCFSDAIYIKKIISVSAGQTVFTDLGVDLGGVDNYKNCYLNIYYKDNKDSGILLGYKIISNTRNSLTIDGLPTAPMEGIVNEITIFVPVYLGSADSPWRAIYTTREGGVRFGMGASGTIAEGGGGQSCRLFVDSATDDLKYTNSNGVTKKVQLV